MRLAARRRATLPALALLAGAVIALVGSPAHADVGTGAGPVAQLNDRLEAAGQAPLLSLFATELLGTAVANGTEVGFEIETVVQRLPCPGRVYRFVATSASLDSSRSSTSEADVRIFYAALPPGIRCGFALPVDFADDGAKVTVRPVNGPMPAPSFYADAGITVESRSSCATFARLCAGTYLLSATIDDAGRWLRLVYVFAVSDTSGVAIAASRPPEVEQCPAI